jgi:hypothetical protein
MTYNFLLYSCSSPDGRCKPVFRKQTTNEQEAYDFLDALSSQYDSGCILCHDSKGEHQFSSAGHFASFMRGKVDPLAFSIKDWLARPTGTTLDMPRMRPLKSQSSLAASVADLVESARAYTEELPESLSNEARRSRVIDLIGHAAEELTELRQHVHRKSWKAEQLDMFTDEEQRRLALFELADVLLFLDCIRHYGGYSMNEVLLAVAQKIETNLTRSDHIHK